MNAEPIIGVWHVTWGGDSEAPVVRDESGNAIATIHSSVDRSRLARAGLIASAPALLDALVDALEVFRAMAEHAEEPANLAAQDMIPVIESAIAAANFLAPITDDDLRGP